MPAVTFTTGGALGKSALRQANERLVLNAIRQNPCASRSDLARMTGLSPSSMTFIVTRLIRHRMVLEEPVENHAQVGRRPTALRLRSDAMMAAGVLITLEGATVGLADLAGTIGRQKTVAWHANPELFLAKVHDAIRSVLERLPARQVLGVGVSLPGFLDRASGKVVAAENLNWFNVEAGSILRGRLSCPFYFENNAKLAALAEMWFADRSAKPLRDFVFLTARDGLGTGVIVNGQILQGASSGAAEFGHTTLYPDGRRCACGNTGCWEQYASDFALARLFSDLSAGAGQHAVNLDAGAVVRAARQGDALAMKAVQETARHLGMGLVNVLMALNPEAVVVGDYLAPAWDLMEEMVWSVLRSRVPSYYLSGVRVFPSKHAVDSSLLGAVALVQAQFFTSFEHANGNLASRSVLMRAWQ